jgi:hypothetical protein
VIESKPEHFLDDLRLNNPWPELKRYRLVLFFILFYFIFMVYVFYIVYDPILLHLLHLSTNVIV